MNPKKPRRKKPTATEQKASYLLQIKREEAWLIPEPLRSTGTAKEICAYVQDDHTIPYAWTRDNRPQNLVPMPKPEHLEKTTKKDMPAIAKVRRAEKRRALTEEQEDSRRVLLKIEGREDQIDRPQRKAKKKWPSRPMDGSRDSRFKVRMTATGRKVEIRKKDESDE